MRVSFAFTANNVSLQTDNIEFLLETTAFSVAASDVELTVDLDVLAESATFTVAAQDLTFILGVAVLAEEVQFEINAPDLELRKTQSLAVSPVGFAATPSALALYQLAAAVPDVTKLYSKGRGKKRFWNAVRARDLRDRGW